MKPPMARCHYCGYDGAAVPVHGHGQCARCGTNIEPCCSGEQASNDAAPTAGMIGSIHPELLVRTFAGLGGAGVTVTAETLRLALAQRLGSDLEDASLLIEAAERIGQLVSTGPGCYRLKR